MPALRGPLLSPTSFVCPMMKSNMSQTMFVAVCDDNFFNLNVLKGQVGFEFR